MRTVLSPEADARQPWGSSTSAVSSSSCPSRAHAPHAASMTVASVDLRGT